MLDVHAVPDAATRARRRWNRARVLTALAALLSLCVVLARDTQAAPGPAPAPLDDTSSCSTAPIPKGDGTDWQCTFDDEFSGTSVDTTKWSVMDTATTHYHSGKECYVNTPNNVYVQDGYLNLTARKEARSFMCGSGASGYLTQYTSGMVSTLMTQAYGRFEIRAKLPGAAVRKGVQFSYWLFPVRQIYGPWPKSGEIDVGEWYSVYPDLVVPYVHYQSATTDPNVTNNSCQIADVTQPHTYTAEWTPDTITIWYDGQLCLQDSWNPAPPLVKPQPFDQPFMLSLTQALGIYTNSFNSFVTRLPATTSIDYVRIWQ